MDGGGSAFNQCLGSSWSVFDLLREVKSNCSLLLSQQLSLVRGPQRFFFLLDAFQLLQCICKVQKFESESLCAPFNIVRQHL